MHTARTILVICFIAIAINHIACADPSPPMWDNVFMFIGSVQQPSVSQYFGIQVFYNWSIPAMTQVFTNNYGTDYMTIHVDTKVYRYNPGNNTCCWCTNEYACGNGTVTPPEPNWLQTGNSTKYLGVSSINERDCNGWAKTSPVAEFGWWTSVASGTPCQMAWLLGFEADFVFSFYSNSSTNIPSDIFEVPEACVNALPDPTTCSISAF